MESLDIFLLHEDVADFGQKLLDAMAQESGLEPPGWYGELVRKLGEAVHMRVVDIWNCSCYRARVGVGEGASAIFRRWFSVRHPVAVRFPNYLFEPGRELLLRPAVGIVSLNLQSAWADSSGEISASVRTGLQKVREFLEQTLDSFRYLPWPHARQGVPNVRFLSRPSRTIPLDEFKQSLDDAIGSYADRSDSYDLQLLQNDPQWEASYNNFFRGGGGGAGLRALWFAGRRLEGIAVGDVAASAGAAEGGTTAEGARASPGDAARNAGTGMKRRRQSEDAG